MGTRWSDSPVNEHGRRRDPLRVDQGRRPIYPRRCSRRLVHGLLVLTGNVEPRRPSVQSPYPDPHLDPPPVALAKANDAQHTARHMPQQDRQPDVPGLEPDGLLQHPANDKGQRKLRDERDVHCAARVARSLKGPVVRQRHRDEEPGDAQKRQQFRPDGRNRGILHSEGPQQQVGDRQEENADPDRDRDPDSGGPRAPPAPNARAFPHPGSGPRMPPSPP